MAKWEVVVRCKKCNKFYDINIPEICEKCGILINTDDTYRSLVFKEYIKLTENAEFVTARKKFFGWEILKND